MDSTRSCGLRSIGSNPIGLTIVTCSVVVSIQDFESWGIGSNPIRLSKLGTVAKLVNASY